MVTIIVLLIAYSLSLIYILDEVRNLKGDEKMYWDAYKKEIEEESNE